MKGIIVLVSLVLIAATTARADDQCSDILVAVRDIYENHNSSQIDQRISHYLSKSRQELQQERTEKIQSGGGGLDIPIMDVIVGASGGFENKSLEEKKTYLWEQLKTQFESSLQENKSVDAFVSVANVTVAEKWAECMRLKFAQQGLTGDVLLQDDAILVTEFWNPPVENGGKAKVEWVSFVNAKYASGQKPLEGVEIGRTGRAFTFVKIDPKVLAMVTIQTDQGPLKAVSPANIPPNETRVTSISEKLLPVYRRLARGERVAASPGTFGNGVFVAWEPMHAYDNPERTELSEDYELFVFNAQPETPSAVQVAHFFGIRDLEHFITASGRDGNGKEYTLRSGDIYHFRVRGVFVDRNTGKKESRDRKQVGTGYVGSQ